MGQPKVDGRRASSRSSVAGANTVPTRRPSRSRRRRADARVADERIAALHAVPAGVQPDRQAAGLARRQVADRPGRRDGRRVGRRHRQVQRLAAARGRRVGHRQPLRDRGTKPHVAEADRVRHDRRRHRRTTTAVTVSVSADSVVGLPASSLVGVSVTVSVNVPAAVGSRPIVPTVLAARRSPAKPVEAGCREPARRAEQERARRDCPPARPPRCPRPACRTRRHRPAPACRDRASTRCRRRPACPPPPRWRSRRWRSC